MKKDSIVFKDVSFSYNNKEFLKDINVSIKDGELVGLIGPNGAGKSTFLKTITNINPIKKGKIFINNKDNSKLKPKDRSKQIAVVPQSFELEYDFTVKDIVQMGRNPYLSFSGKESENDLKIVDEALKLTKTDKFKDRLFNTLSGGEKQLVLLARAIAQDTDIILLDEPTASLDIFHQLEVMNIVQELNKEGKTIVTILHDLNLAARFCDRLLLLENGQIKADGTPKEVITKENLENIYKVEAIIDDSTFDKPQITPVSSIKKAE